MATAAGIAPFLWNAKGEAVTKAQLERERKIADALRPGGNYRPTGPWSLLGGLAREGVAKFREDQADAREKEASGAASELWSGLADGYDENELMAVIGNEFTAPGQSAIANALLGRTWDKADQAEEWAREDARAAASARAAAAEAAKPKWKTIEVGGDVYRYNEDDPESRPEMFFDGPDAPPEAPNVVEVYDPVTGLPRKQQWGGNDGWQDLGGVSAPKEPLTSVTVNNGGADEEFYKAGAKARGEQFAATETAGYQAQTKMGQINRLEQLLATAPQGIEGGWKQFAGEFGIASEGLDDIQAAQALINKLVPEQRTPGSGPMSDADLALFKQSMPRILNQPGGNARIIQTLRGISVYEQTMGEIASKVLNKDMTPAEGRAEMAKVRNPLEMFRADGGSASDVGTPPAGIDPEVWSELTPEERQLWD